MPDYAALAEQARQSAAPAPPVDYAALADQARTQAQYPTFSRIPGFSAVRPVADALAGAGGNLADHAVNAYNLIRSIPGASAILPDAAAFQKSIQQATPDNTAAHIGKFLEGTAEYMLPAGKVAEATRGAGLLARTGAQALVGGGVTAAQTAGDPGSTALGAALGAGGELAGAAVTSAKTLFEAKSPTLANFAESFGGATPTQKARITKALDTLTRDGIVPPDSVHATQDVINGKLDDLTQAYQALDPAIRAREVNPNSLIGQLRKVQANYTQRGVVTDEAAYKTVEDQIEKVKAIALKNGGVTPPPAVQLYGANGQPMNVNTVKGVPGKVNLDDLLHMKQNANGRTNWQSPDVEKSLWNNIGDAYRSAADALAPETTPINQDFQKYKDLQQIIEQNIAQGKGATQSGLSALVQKGAQHAAGAAGGGAIGGAIAGPVGAGIGSIAGSIIGPKLGKAAAQAVQNAVDSGAFRALTPIRQNMIRSAAAIGDNAAVLKMLGTAATEESAVQR